jgi:hypothetical protein
VHKGILGIEKTRQSRLDRIDAVVCSNLWAISGCAIGSVIAIEVKEMEVVRLT